jgi:hypothetical protein
MFAFQHFSYEVYLNKAIIMMQFVAKQPNGLRYLRWGGDGEAVQPEK